VDICPVYLHVGGTKAVDMGLPQRHTLDNFASIVDPEIVSRGFYHHFIQRLFQSKAVQNFHRIGTVLDTRANLTQLRCGLVYFYRIAGL